MKWRSFITLSTVIVFMTACSTHASEKDEAIYELRLGITQNADNAEYKGILQFKEAVEDRTNNRLKVETYHSGQLASVPDLVEQASVGAAVGTISDAAMLGDMKHEFYMLQSPYLFEDREEIEELIHSSLFHQWTEEFAGQGLRVLSFNYFLGERNLATVNPILAAEDVRGNVIRTNGSQIVNAGMEAMGASPSGMPWTEAYPGLQQGVIDGVEAHHLAIYESSLYEVINHIAKTNHYSLTSALVVSEKWFAQLPEDIQEIVTEEAINSGEHASELAQQTAEEYEEAMKAYGIEFHEIDTEPFKENVQPIYERLGLRDIVRQVESVLAEEGSE
ncbi:TRAP transporter solute receptor [Bacillus sp. JCM 19046]|nr:TRAP transporter solute receptor [Bacillus sp. JCM 19045]GAF19073.1 TRAP transporter solute receptor [Bacillus sp. JCM 19046]